MYCAALLNQNSACRFLTLDAKRDPDKGKDSLLFYAKCGFKILGHRDAEKTVIIPMYFDIIKAVKEKLINNVSVKTSENGKTY